MNPFEFIESVIEKNASDYTAFATFQNQNELGWITSSTSKITGYAGNPKKNAEIQEKVNNAVGGLSIVYLFAHLEEKLPRELWKIASSESGERMYAYLHIRNTMAHGFEGLRSKRYRNEFDKIMSSQNFLRGIKKHDEEKIQLTPYIWQAFQQDSIKFFMEILNLFINGRYDEKDLNKKQLATWCKNRCDQIP